MLHYTEYQHLRLISGMPISKHLPQKNNYLSVGQSLELRILEREHLSLEPFMTASKLEETSGTI